jgi:hypothetical protein
MKKLLFISLALFSTVFSSTEEARASLLDRLSGEWISRAIYTANQLEISDFLMKGPKDIEELAKLTKTHPDSLKRIMRILTNEGLYIEESGLYRNSEVGALLAKDHPDTLHSVTQFYGEEVRKSFDELKSSVESGVPAFNIAYHEPVFVYFKENLLRAKLFQSVMKEKSSAVIKSVCEKVDFSKYASLADIGGGNGAFLNGIKQKNSNLKTYLFERPEIIAIANAPTSNLVPGDFFKSINITCDAYLLKSIIHDWNDEQAITILSNIRQAMPEKAEVLIVDIVLLPNGEKPYADAMDLLMLTMVGGKERTFDEFKSIAELSGFEIVQVIDTSTEFSVLRLKMK